MRKLVFALLMLLGTAHGPALHAADLDACGSLSAGIPGTYCSDLVFHVQSEGYFFLDDYGGFSAGDSLHVVASYPPACWVPCPDADGCLVVEAIERCAPTSARNRSWGTIKNLYR